jgi:hypothetical protein
MPDLQSASVEHAIATKLHDVYKLVREAADENHEDSVRYGLLNSIAVLLHQPLEVVDRITTPPRRLH